MSRWKVLNPGDPKTWPERGRLVYVSVRIFDAPPHGAFARLVAPDDGEPRFICSTGGSLSLEETPYWSEVC